MAVKDNSGRHFVQCGVTALRDPATGGFLPAVPLYIEVDASEIEPRTGLAASEEKLCFDIGQVMAEKFGAYVNGCRREGVRI